MRRLVLVKRYSQLEPSYKIKRCLGGWPNGSPSWASSQENHLIVWLRPRSHLAITKQLGSGWLELAEVAKRWKSLLDFGDNSSLIKFKPTPANSSQVGGQMIPNSIQVENLAGVGWSWEYHLARAFEKKNDRCSGNVRVLMVSYFPSHSKLAHSWCFKKRPSSGQPVPRTC